VIELGPDFRLPPLPLTELQKIFVILVLYSLLVELDQRSDAKAILTSWARTEVLNEGARGRSLHLVQNGALGLDAVIDQGFVASLVESFTDSVAFRLPRFFRSLAPPYTQCVVESDHLHFELDLSGA